MTVCYQKFEMTVCHREFKMTVCHRKFEMTTSTSLETFHILKMKAHSETRFENESIIFEK
jgi:hypothetical protein